jgi:hypothetical protein
MAPRYQPPPVPGPCNLRVATWNVAAVNNNPFEYYITHDDPAYNALMAAGAPSTNYVYRCSRQRASPHV